MASRSRNKKKTPDQKAKYRVFLSYSHRDDALARKVRKALAGRVEVMWDKSFRVGRGFHEQIKLYIAHSHIFVPILTESSLKRGWVHQEIGFAASLNIPVLPIARDKNLPAQMLERLQAIVLDDKKNNWMKEVRQAASRKLLKGLVERFDDPEMASLHCAELPEDRAKMMTTYADEVRHLGHHGMVRQKGALSSFHIPRASLDNPTWRKRYGKVKRTRHHCRRQRQERIALENHARKEGCRLIVNDRILYKKYGKKARRVRLQSLLDFLESDIAQVEIVIDRTLNRKGSQTFVGDWFSAEAISSTIGAGYHQTVFTRHAPSMQAKVEEFDQHFDELLEKRGLTRKNSRAYAIKTLKKEIKKLR